MSIRQNTMSGCEIRIEEAKDLSTRIFVDGAQLKRVISYSITQHHALRTPVTMSVTHHTGEPFCVECTTVYPIRQLTIIADREPFDNIVSFRGEPFTPTPEPVTMRLEVDASQASALIDDTIQAVAGVSATTAALINQIIERDARGKAKYGTTLDRTDLSLADWLQHQAEELADGAGYALAAKREAEKLLAIKKAARWLVMGLNEHAPRLRHDALRELNELLKDD